MSVLFVALGVGIVSYIVVILMFPKAVPENANDITRQALNRIYEENRANDAQHRNVLRDNLQDENPLARALFSLGFMQPLYEVALQAGYQKALNQVLIAMLLLMVGIAWGILQAGVTPLTLVAAPLLGYYLPYRHCRKRIAKRNAKFIDQFPDALDMIVRSVRSGFPISVALQMLAENTEDPVREEFRQVVDDIALGRTLAQALERLEIRISEPDIRFFVVVLAVQQETGGNLAETISNLSTIIRKRKQLRHKIRAITSEGRATGWVLGSLPVLVFLALYFVQRDYIQVFWQDSLGRWMLLSVVLMITSCIAIIRKMVQIDI